jgi:hypothetical protein
MKIKLKGFITNIIILGISWHEININKENTEEEDEEEINIEENLNNIESFKKFSKKNYKEENDDEEEEDKLESILSWSEKNVIAFTNTKEFLIKEKICYPIFLILPNDIKNHTLIITEHNSIIKHLSWSSIYCGHLLMSFDKENLLCIWKNKVNYYYYYYYYYYIN